MSEEQSTEARVPHRIPISRGLVALVDEEDYERLTAMGKWYAHPSGNTVYARRDRDGMMHTVITGWPMVDHKDGNGLNNQRANLRPTDHASNLANSRIRKDNTSGFKGVHLHVPPPRWVAAIRSGKKRRALGRFKSREEAAAAYDIAAREEFGEFANPNFPAGECGPLQQDAQTWAAAGLAAALSGDREAMRRCLDRLSLEELLVADLAACVYLNAIGEATKAKTLAQRASKPCAWCGLDDCPDRFGHARLDSQSETSWRRR